MFAVYALAALAAVAGDQLIKYFVTANISLGQIREFLPGIMSLTYVRNDGAAFSSFRGMQWLFALIFTAFTLYLIWEYFRRPLPFTRFDRWCLAAVWSGGLGNMIDRLRFGYVIDMFSTDFISFPVFNLADCFITCACILLAVHLIFFNREFWKDGSKNAADR